MNKFRSALAGFSGIYMLVCAWLLPIWYTQHLRADYATDLFLKLANPTEIAMWVALLFAAAAATAGLILRD